MDVCVTVQTFYTTSECRYRQRTCKRQARHRGGRSYAETLEANSYKDAVPLPKHPILGLEAAATAGVLTTCTLQDAVTVTLITWSLSDIYLQVGVQYFICSQHPLSHSSLYYVYQRCSWNPWVRHYIMNLDNFILKPSMPSPTESRHFLYWLCPAPSTAGFKLRTSSQATVSITNKHPCVCFFFFLHPEPFDTVNPRTN